MLIRFMMRPFEDARQIWLNFRDPEPRSRGSKNPENFLELGKGPVFSGIFDFSPGWVSRPVAEPCPQLFKLV